LAEQLEAFAPELCIHRGEACDVPAWVGQAVDKAALHRGASRRHDNRDRLGGYLGSSDRGGKMGDDDIDAKLDQFGGERTGAGGPSPCITRFDRDVLVFDIAEILQTSSEGIGERMWRRRGDQHPDPGQSFYLLWKCPTRSAKQSRGQYADENASVQRSSSSSPCGYCRAISREPRT